MLTIMIIMYVSVLFPLCYVRYCSFSSITYGDSIHAYRYTTASAKVRKQCFEAFWYTHHLAFFFMMALFTHATGCFVRDSPNPDYKKSFPFYSTEHCLGYESWRFIIWPFLLYFSERLVREVRARKQTTLDKVLVHPSGMPTCFVT